MSMEVKEMTPELDSREEWEELWVVEEIEIEEQQPSAVHVDLTGLKAPIPTIPLPTNADWLRGSLPSFMDKKE
jgi:hypothetical protein